jgi:hypothetical protein
MIPSELEIHIEKKTLDRASVELEQERAKAKAEGETERAALASNDLGVVYMLRNLEVEARAALGEAQLLFIEVGDPAGQGRAVGNLAQIEERAGNSDAAGALYMQAADLLHEGQAYGDEYATRRRLSRYYMKRGATLQSLNESARALAVKPNANAWDKFQKWFYALPLKWMGVG